VQYTHSPSQDGDAAFTAGHGAPEYKPTTYVNEVVYNEMVIPHGNLSEVFDDILTSKVKAKGNFPDPPKPPAPQLSVELLLTGTQIKTTTVEKYNDPGWDFKREFILQASLKITGEIFYPPLTKTFTLPGFLGGDTLISTKLGLAAIGTMQIGGGFVADPSKEDEDWKINSVLSADASLALRAQASVTLDLGPNWKGVASGSGQIKVGTKGTWDALSPNEIVLTPYVNPLSVEVDIYVQRKVQPKEKKSLFPKQTWELIPKYTGPPGIISLGSLFD
jgi:hypothetical protein